MPKNPLYRLATGAVVFGTAIGLSACATYSPLPLDTKAAGKNAVAELQHEGPLPVHLSVNGVERLALANNPELIAARTAHGLSRSQVQLAGILPNPIFNGSYQDVLGGPGSFTAIAAAISQDIKSLVTLSAKRRAAEKAALSADAT